jgi:pilus assembly protein CpaC
LRTPPDQGRRNVAVRQSATPSPIRVAAPPSSALGAARPRRFHRLAWTLALAASVAGTAFVAAGMLSPARAQTRMVEIGESRVGSVRVVQGKSQTLQVSQGFVDLVVGDPEVADVMPLTDRTMYVLGKRLGITNVSVYDAAKRLVGVIDVEVGTNAPRIAADLAADGDAAGTRVTSANGRTVLSGSVADAVAASKAVTLARQYGPEVVNDLKVRGSQQVMLEVRFLEASRSAAKDLAVNSNFTSTNLSGRTGNGTLSGQTPFGQFLGTILGRGVRADVLVEALEQRGLARRLAEPNLIALSGEKASFLAGGEYPIPIQADQGRVTVAYKKFGVSLDFLPTVLSNGLINLKIEPEVSSLDVSNGVSTGGGITVPALTVRRALTVVELRSGQSFAIAGLLQSVNQTTQEQLPWLADVPILGALFRSASFEKKETELAIIVTPHLVKPARPGETLRSPLDNRAPANDLDLFLVGQQEVDKAAHKVANTVGPPPSGYILDLPKVRHAPAR